MGREVKRVPLDFGLPLHSVWPGYVPPVWRSCPAGSRCVNGETPDGAWLSSILILLGLIDSRRDGLFTSRVDTTAVMHPWLEALPVRPSRRGGLEWAALMDGLGDSDYWRSWRIREGIISAAGLDPETWGTCPVCEGDGIHPDDREASESWERTEPPNGDGWQVWETVSEGSPVTPVFPTAEKLIEYMCQEGNSVSLRGNAYTREQATLFVERGWASSLVFSSKGLTDGIGGTVTS